MSQNQTQKSLISLTSELEMDLFDSEGEITDAIAEKLAQVASKVDGAVFVLERFDKVGEHYKQKADHLYKIAKAAEKAQDRLKEYIKNAMQAMDTRELSGEDFTFKATNAPPKVIIEDETALPTEYLTTKVVTSPDKKGIAKAIEAGGIVSGARLEYSVGLRIYPKKPG